ncbi:MAG: 3'-5' exonuclease, partial [Elusimicrobiota bacterium]
GIGRTTYKEIVKISEENGISLLGACQQIERITNKKNIKLAARKITNIFNEISGKGAGSCLSSLTRNMKYFAKLKAKSSDEKQYEDRRGNVEEFINDAFVFQEGNNSICDYLHQIALVSSADKEAKDAVSLMTIHAAKGLEFPIVFIVGVEENILPHELSLRDGNAKDKKNDTGGEFYFQAVEEERRVFYVGITRAEKRLFLSSCLSRTERRGGSVWQRPSSPSRFLKEINLLSE